MKIQLLKKIILFLAFLVVLVSCSKEDDSKESVNQTGGEISRSQIVTVNLPNIVLSEKEYLATIDGVSVTLIKSEDNKLLFLLPYSTTVGVHTLTIPALNNAIISYDVKDTVLSGTPEAVMVDFFTNLNTFSQSLDTSPEGVAVRNTLNSFKNYYSSASVAEKTEIAILYKANKAQFDSVFLFNLNSTTMKTAFLEKAKLAVAKNAKGVALIATGAIAITSGAPILGCALAAVGAYKAYKANEEAVDNLVATIGTEIGGFFGISNKIANAALISKLTFNDNISSQVSFNVVQRGIIESDEAKTKPLAQQYFKYYNQYNYYAKKNNIEIQKINNVKGTNFDLIPLEILPVTNPEVKTIVNSDVFKNIQFTLTHPNLRLVSTTLESDGKLNIKIEITGIATSFPLESFINYSYSDDFSSFSGKLPINVQPSIIGTWKLVSFENGKNLGEFVNYAFVGNCSNIATAAYTLLNETYVIKENEYSYSGIQRDKYLNVVWSNCAIIDDKPDTTADYNYSGSGTYTVNGNSFVIVEDGNTDTIQFQFITQDKIKIGENVYERQ